MYKRQAEWELGGMTGYCVGVTVGACLGAFLLPFRVAAAGGLRLSPVFRHPLLKRFLIMALPLMLGQTVIFLDEQFMRVFGSLVGDGAVSLLHYARRIMQVPVGLMGPVSYTPLDVYKRQTVRCAAPGGLRHHPHHLQR